MPRLGAKTRLKRTVAERAMEFSQERSAQSRPIRTAAERAMDFAQACRKDEDDCGYKGPPQWNQYQRSRRDIPKKLGSPLEPYRAKF